MDLPWKFPDPHKEARERGQAFQRLSSDERVRAMLDTIAAGMILIEESPNRRVIKRLMGIEGSDSRDGTAHGMQSRPLPGLLVGVVRLCEAARHWDLPHALIGSLAAGYWTFTQFPRVISLLIQVPPTRLPSLLAELAGHEFICDPETMIREWEQERRTTLSFRGIPVDWLSPVIPLAQHVLDRATDETWLDHPVRVASAEGLILIKLLAYRTQDQLDIENLVDAHRDTLDLEWIQSEWATVARPDDRRMVRLVELMSSRG